jgi:hypothetical protein
MKHLNDDELHVIEEDAAIIAKNAAQSKLLDAAGDGVEFAQHLRNVWEIIYFRGSGGIALPDIEFDLIDRTADSESAVVLNDITPGFGKSTSDVIGGKEEDEDDEEEEEDEEEDDLLMSMDGRSSLEGTGADSEDEDMDRRWTFTSESVEDYLLRRKMEEKEEAAMKEREGLGGRDLEEEGDADLHSSLVGEVSVGSKSRSRGGSQELAPRSPKDSPLQNKKKSGKKKKVRIVGYWDADMGDSDVSAAPTPPPDERSPPDGDAREETLENGPHNTQDTAVSFNVEVGERRVSVPVAVANVVSFLSGSFGGFGKAKAKVSDSDGEEFKSPLSPPPLNTITLGGPGETAEDSHARIRYSEHMTTLLSIQKQRNDAAAAEAVAQLHGNQGRAYSSDINDDADGRGYLDPKTPHAPTKPPTGARGVLRRSVTTNYDPSMSMSTDSDASPSIMLPRIDSASTSLSFHHTTSEAPSSSQLADSSSIHISLDEESSLLTSMHEISEPVLVDGQSSGDGIRQFIPPSPLNRKEYVSIDNDKRFDGIADTLDTMNPDVIYPMMTDSMHDTTSAVEIGSAAMDSVAASSTSGRTEDTLRSQVSSAPPHSASSKMRIDIRAITSRSSSPTADLGMGLGDVVFKPETPPVAASVTATESAIRSVQPAQSVNSLMQSSQHTAATVYRPEVVSPALVPPRGALLLEENSEDGATSLVWQKTNSSSYHMCDVMLPFDQHKGKDLKASLKLPYKPPLMTKKTSHSAPAPVQEAPEEVPREELVEELSTMSDIKAAADDYTMLVIENCPRMQAVMPPQAEPPDLDKFSIHDDVYNSDFLGALRYELVHSEEITMSERWRRESTTTTGTGTTSESRRVSVLSMGCGIGDDFFSRDDVDGSMSSVSPPGKERDRIDLSKRIDPTAFHKRLYLSSAAKSGGGTKNIIAVTGNGPRGVSLEEGEVDDDAMVMETEKGYSYRLKPYEVQLLNGEKLERTKKIFVDYPIHKTG